MRTIKSIIFTLSYLVLFQFSHAHQQELSVGQISIPPQRWGEQTASFEVTNNVNNVKYLMVKTEVQFTGSYLSPNRCEQTHYVLEPLESRTLTTAVYIPGNYGQAKVTFSFCDVVDTLDTLVPGQKFFEKSSPTEFIAPDEMLPYLSQKVALLPKVSPMIGHSLELDNELACLALILLDEGKTIKEIATMAKTDTSFVKEVVQNMIDKKHLKKRDGMYRATFSLKVPTMNLTDILVGEIDLSSLRWGQQSTAFEVTNNTDELKFITVEIEVQFSGSYLNPNRRTRSHYILQPVESRVLTPTIYIPGNYGRSQIKLSLYEVVDTLDILLPDQKFFEQPFLITFHIPDKIIPYLNEKVTLPPRVERHPDFDNEFARAVLTLLNEGNTVDEIASIAMTDTSFVQEVVQNMTNKAYVRKKDNSYEVTFPIITVSEAEEAKKLAVKLSDTLATVIENNLSHYKMTLDSLVSVGAVDKDSNSFMDGGSILYRPYPVVSALLLWFDLGRKFITRSAPLLIYDGTDLCRAHIPQYMYAVQGGDTFNGTQFYALFLGNPKYQILYGDAIPIIKCAEDYVLKSRLRQGVDWRYGDEFQPESFMVDTMVIKPALNALDKGTDSLLVNAYYKLRDVAVKYGHRKLLYGERYWFWNLVVTRTLKKLVDNGVVTRRGNGQFKIDGL